MLKTKTTVQQIPWSLNLRTRVGDTVTHDSNTWVNITGKNSEPGIGTDWEVVLTPGADTEAPAINVVLDSGKSLGKYVNGDTIPAALTIQDQLRDIAQEAIPPTFTLPTGSVSSSITASLLYEIGQILTMNLSTGFTQNDGGTLDSQNIEKDDVSIATASPLNNYALTISGTTQKIDATLNYLAGSGTKNDSLGNPVPNPIVAGAIDTNDLNYRGIYPVFFFTSDTDPTIDQALVNGSTKLVSGAFQVSSTGTITINFATGATPKFLVFGFPATSANKTSWFVNALNNGAIGGAANLFGDPTNININSPESRWSNVGYEFYKTNFATIINENMQLRN